MSDSLPLLAREPSQLRLDGRVGRCIGQFVGHHAVAEILRCVARGRSLGGYTTLLMETVTL